MNKEEFTIQSFKNQFLGDDGVMLAGEILSKDIFCEGTHFKREWLSFEQIGYKAMMVNFSDSIAMNSAPKYALLGLCLPKDIKTCEISSLCNGIKKACNEYNVSIIGGDTIASDKICISVSIVAKPKGKVVYRKNMKNGDLIAHTGTLGSSLKSLNLLLRGGVPSPKSRFFKPILRQNFFFKAAKFINSAMDISDGLAQDLPKLCKSSNLSFKFIKKIGKIPWQSGEEYEILFTFSPKNLKAIKRLAQKSRTRVEIFAKAQKGRYKNNVRKHHF
ncbi:MAG: thiamine-phosphate kinase [Campylobacter sp.]|nr:thiamine-phosphate kinase [Campylobacter sp.]